MSRVVRSGWLDWYLIGLLAAAALGFILPAGGAVVSVLTVVTKIAVAMLFFFHGARLQKSALIAGATHWRLQALTLLSTFAVFPLLGVALHTSVASTISPALWPGVLYLCVLPSTIQSSITLTSIAGGNVSAAVCAATMSNIVGIVLTPLLVAAVLNLHGDGIVLDQIQSIVAQLLVPFILGHALSGRLRPWTERHSILLSRLDRGTILLIVYASFSAAVVAGTWRHIQSMELAVLVLMSMLLLAIVLAFTYCASGLLKFTPQDASAAVFCGSKKSLATGVPMANILFPASAVGLVILPVMIFHQLQLIVCSFLASRRATPAALGGSRAARDGDA